MTAHIEFDPANVVMDLHSPKGTKVADVQVVGMPEGITAKLHLVDNASRRVELNGNSIILSQNLVDDSDMHITVEAPIENSYIDNTLHVMVRVGENRGIRPEEVTRDNQAPHHHLLESNASANFGEVDPNRIKGATGEVQTTKPDAYPPSGYPPAANTGPSNDGVVVTQPTANYRIPSEEPDIGPNPRPEHKPTDPMTVSNAQNVSNTTENKANANADSQTANANSESKTANVTQTAKTAKATPAVKATHHKE